MDDEAVFVIDGHDIELYPDAGGAAREIEGYDAQVSDHLGADGTVYVAAVVGPEWGAVILNPTQENRLDDLIHLLRSEAEHRGLTLPRDVPDDPEAMWGALLVAQEEHLGTRRAHRVDWLKRGAKDEPTGE